MGRRKHPRAEISLCVNLLFKKLAYSDCLIRNFSKGGLFLAWGESALARVLKAGFYESGQREQAVIELDGGRLSAMVEIAYVNQSGLGVAFVDPDETLFTYLQQATQDSVPVTEARSEPLEGIESIRSIIQILQNNTLNFLENPFMQFLVSAKEDLLAATERSLLDGEQGDLFFAVTTLETEGTKIHDDFYSKTAAGFSALLAQGEQLADETPRNEARQSQLELVDKEEFDEWILLDGMAHKIEAQLATQIYQLNYALSHLFRRLVKQESNPLSPVSMLLQIKAALEDYTFTPGAKKIVYQAFSQSIFTKIHRLYGELIACLNEDGIKTEQSASATQLNPSPVMQNEYAGYANLRNLSVLLDAANNGQVEPSDQETRYPVASRQQVMESMESMPRQGRLLRQLEKHLTHADTQRLSLDPLTRAAIGASEELVGAVQQDDFLTHDVQQLVNQLEIPFIKESINDPRILENTQHPGRLFLEAVEELAPYVTVSEVPDRQGRGYRSGLRRLIDEIQSGAIDNINDVTEQIEVLHDKQKENFERNCNLAIESCTRQERLRQAQGFVKTTLEEMVLGKSVSIALDRLFEYGWANLLIQTAMLHGPYSMQCKAYLRVVNLLLKLFRVHKPFKRLTEGQAYDILKVIKKGFNDYPVHPEGARKFAAELMRALVDADESAAYFTANQRVIDEVYLTRLFQGYVMQPEQLGGQAVEQHWIDQVENLQVGDWIVQRDAGECLRLVNLAWKNPELDKYLLVDGNGIKVQYLSTPHLALQFAENKLGLLENRDTPVVDRAIQRILKDGYDSVQHEVSYDELTGLHNRRAFERLLTEVLRGGGEEGELHTIILLDVDQFGLVNDLCGFEGGDKLLRSIANILRTYLPENAHLARTGDDEFAILVAQNFLDQGFQLAEEHRLAINAFKYTWGNQVIPVSASVGVVSIDSREQTSTELLKAVSSACSIAKQSGRNCTRIYRAADRDFIEHRELIDSVAVIEDALENNKIVLVAQLIAPLQEGADAAHYEILLRVEGDNGELQSPVHFILAAERYNLMRSVDRWVVDAFFETANRHIQDLRAVGGFSINLSSQSMADQEFKAYLIEQIENSPVPKDKLGFEITETAMLTDSREAVNFIKEIKETGCSFYLDDFGSGYASFSYLKEMPVDYVKIDGIFIRDLLQDKASHEMVKAVTGIAHFMNKRVVAEFVENQQTADALKKIGVDYIQGYLIGRPVPLHHILTADACVNVC